MSVWHDVFSLVTGFGALSSGACLLIGAARREDMEPASRTSLTPLAVALLLVSAAFLANLELLPIPRTIGVLVLAAAAVACLFASVFLWRDLVAVSRTGGRGKSEGDETGLTSEVDELRRKLRDLTEISGDWIWQTDERGVLTYVSEGVRSNLGLGPEHFLGRQLVEIGEEEQDPSHRQIKQSLFSNREAFRNVLFRCRAADGEEKLIQVSGSPCLDQDGAFKGYSGIGSDSTSEFRLREARAAAQAKDRFLAAMSHEIRTPLNGVLGILDILKDSPLGEDQKRLVSTATHSGESLLHIINEVLDLSKLEAGRLEILPEPGDLDATIVSIADALRPLADKNHTRLSIEGLGTIPSALVFDSHRFRQILTNLVGNAIKFTKNGEIRISISIVDRSHSGLRIRTSVIDTGPGIPLAKQTLLFKEFSMLHDPRRTNATGTGLGLALCRRLAEAMGGSVGVTSEEGKGSTFWVEIVFGICSATKVARHPSQPAADRSDRLVPMRILLAEDNATNALVATRMLTSEGHQVDHVDNGLKARQAYQTGSFDVIFMDVSMPTMDGIAAAKEIRQLEVEGNRPAIPIIALTAHAIASERERIMAAGMSGFLTKPVRKKELLEELARHVPARRDRRAQIDMLKVAKASAARRAAPTIPGDRGPVVRASAGGNARAGYKSQPILDLEALRGLADDTGVDELPRLAGMFGREMAKRAEQLRKSRNEKDVILLMKTCHAIAGSSGTIGGRRLQQLASGIDRACNKSAEAKYLILIDTVLDEIDLLLAQLSKLDYSVLQPANGREHVAGAAH